MKKRTLSPEHLAKLQAGRLAAQKAKETAPINPGPDDTVHVAPDQSTIDLQAQIAELKQAMAAMQAGMKAPEAPNMNKQGDLIGEWEKYLVDPANYPDPTPRLKAEPRLQNIAFNHNYELNYTVSVSSYETKTGKNVKEPKFHVDLYRIVLNDQGDATDKRYVARKMVFHEDPQAALVIAREQGVDVDKSNEANFLNEMRYLRVRDWLFNVFWPRPADEQHKIHEEVIGGSVVQVFTKNSVDSSEIDFSKLNKKVV